MAHPPHRPLEAYYPDEPSRKGWVRSIFDRTATDYDRVERAMAFGSGAWYRRRMLIAAGLEPGMRVLDVAVGTGLVAREAAGIVGDPRQIHGLDPSFGMMATTRSTLPIHWIQGTAERLPFADARFDFLSMGFALRHVSDVDGVFEEYRRVLKPGGRVCILEITRPEGRVRTTMMKAYMRGVVPALARVLGGNADTSLLMRYYWDTIEACIPPEAVLEALRRAGFAEVERYVELGIFSAYRGTRPS